MTDFGDLVTKKAPRKNYKKGNNSSCNRNPTFPEADPTGSKPLMTTEEWEAFCAERRKQ